jgi:hypothetical protein
MQDKKEEWVTMSEAAARLGIAASKLSRLVKAGKIQTRKDTVDERVRLVEFNQVRDLLQSSVRYKK